MSDEEDILLRALRELPAPKGDERAHFDGQLGILWRRADDRAAFVRASQNQGGKSSFGIGRFAMPVVLAGVCFFYLGWAFAAVNALAH